MHLKVIALLAVGIGTAASAAPSTAVGPCGADATMCEANLGRDAVALDDAWKSPATSDDQRDHIASAIKSNTSASKTDWTKAKIDYFSWRASSIGYAYDPNAVSKTIAEQKAERAVLYAKAERITHPNFAELRKTAESAVRARLIDPSSAEFEWPYGFLYSTAKPFLGKTVLGFITCGTVNSKNRMGGYVGAVPFFIVIDGEGQVSILQIADQDKYNISIGVTEGSCRRQGLPAPQPGMLDNSQAASTLGSGDIADELGKLAKLKDSGVLSQTEFDSQKAKLLSR